MHKRHQDLHALLAAADDLALAEAAAANPRRVLRFLVGRLCSADASEKSRAVRVLGRLAGDRALLSESQGEELLRRFVWALNDESGAVPYGIPEAMAEVLANRPELAPRFLPLLGSCIDSGDLGQAGVILHGVLWGLGRLGSLVLEHAPDAVAALRRTAADHPDPRTRRAAIEALHAILTNAPDSG